ncbi:MAG: efflux RND transporter periplasmic adaptor subunit [Proteobacteria bacterium]|nr:efflux RND transporter periplasmic adaptor subunit [Desulfobulbaceae bacterium]MBU4152489.1 efflux RND transporter periplasmic adaptor subunit [Pseudomonadota bacterium]
MSKTKTTLLIIFIALLTALAGAGGFFFASRVHQKPEQTSPPTGTSTAPSEEAAHGHEEDHHEEHPQAAASHDEKVDEHGHAKEESGHDGHDHGAEGSDLDRPVDEMWAASCEHNIPQHECDECRYEIGMVKLDAVLLGDQGLVRTGFPTKRHSSHEERAMTGEVQLDETRTVHMASPLTGLITRSFAKPGIKVTTSDPLFEVDSTEVAEAKSNYLKALAGLTLARKVAEREALLFSRKVAAEVEVQEAQAKQAEAETEIATARGRLLRLGLSTTEIENISTKSGSTALNGRVVVRASRTGTIIEGHATPGEHAETGKELLTISDLDTIWVLADLKETDLPHISSASAGEARIDAMGRSFIGQLDTIAGRMSEETRTAKARFSVNNSEGLLKPGMFVSVNLLLPAKGESIAVPKVAVLADEGRTFVFTHKEGEFWVRRPVTLGQRFDDMVEITSGITPEQKIITDGSFLLKSDVLRGKMGAGCAD